MVASFIPAGSEIVIRRTNGQYEWYTTQKDVDVTGATVENCPIREIPVMTMVFKGFKVWFLDSQINYPLSNEQKETACKLRMVFLQYDVPTQVMSRGQITHPSQYLWSMGVRTSLSCWVLPTANIPYVQLRELTRAGCTWHVTRVDVSEAPALLQRAIGALQRERADAQQRAIESSERAVARRNDQTNGSLNTRENRYRADVKRIEKALSEALENVEKGAKALGIPLTWVNNATVRAVTQSISAGYHQRAEAVGAVVDAANRMNLPAVARDVTSGAMPADIAAEMLAEKDNSVFSLVENLTENDE